MRRVAAALLASWLAACGGADSAADAQPAADAITLTDARMRWPDAGPIPEPPPPACVAGATTVVVTDFRGTPLAGVDVFASDGAGELLVATVTDDDGAAVFAALPAAAQVTVARDFVDIIVPAPVRVTWTDVTPDACLRVQAQGRREQVGTATLVPGDNPPPATSLIWGRVAGHNCGTGFGDVVEPFTVPVGERCIGSPGFISVVALAFRDPSGPLIAFTPVADLPYWSGDILVPLPDWRDDFVTWELDVANSSADSWDAKLLGWTTRRGRLVGDINFAIAYWLDALPPGASHSQSFPTPVVDRDLDGALSLTVFSSDAGGERRLVRTQWPATLLPTIDVADLPPAADGISIDDPHAARPVIAWTNPALPATVDLVQVTARVAPFDSFKGGWVVLADPARWQVHLPALPPSLAPWPPDVGVTEVTVQHFDASTIDGYVDTFAVELREEDLFESYFLLHEPSSAPMSIGSAYRSASF